MTRGDFSVRAIRAADWRRVRALRLRALQDAAAPIAFLDTHANALHHPDQFWVRRAQDAGRTDGDARQFVAETRDEADGDDRWLGTATVLLRPVGFDDDGVILTAPRGLIVGVYITPEARGQGVLDALVDAIRGWLAARDVHEVTLHVHRDNTVARRAYERCGFAPTGRRLTTTIGEQIEMGRAV